MLFSGVFGKKTDFFYLSKLYAQTFNNLLLQDKAKSIVWGKKMAKKPLPFFESLYSSVSVGNCVNEAEFWILITVFKFRWHILPSR